MTNKERIENLQNAQLKLVLKMKGLEKERNLNQKPDKAEQLKQEVIEMVKAVDKNKKGETAMKVIGKVLILLVIFTSLSLILVEVYKYSDMLLVSFYDNNELVKIPVSGVLVLGLGIITTVVMFCILYSMWYLIVPQVNMIIAMLIGICLFVIAFGVVSYGFIACIVWLIFLVKSDAIFILLIVSLVFSIFVLILNMYESVIDIKSSSSETVEK